MPNLENLKKQAKLYLRWHREGYYPVAARIRAELPRFRSSSDRDVLESDVGMTMVYRPSSMTARAKLNLAYNRKGTFR